MACRRSNGPASRARLRSILAPYISGSKKDFCRRNKIGWSRYYADFDLTSPELTTSLVLKAPGASGEKGVLYTAFEYNLMRLLAHSDAQKVLSEYIVVGASSWSPTDYAVMASFAGLSDDPIFLGISNADDIQTYEIAAPAVRALPILASDWIDPSRFEPLPHEKREIDILMVANFSRFKRHWLLFDALRKMPRNLRVTILGIATPDRTADVLHAEARAFGAPQDLEIRTNLSIEEVARYQSNARVSLMLSRREGSCVATAESLFADSPVGMMCDAHIGSKDYINERTGVLFEYRGLARQLSAFLERSATFSARSWAMANISAQQTSDRLNRILKEHALATGRPWTRDIAPMCWRYVPTYLHSGDAARLQPAVNELQTRHGVRLKVFTYQPSEAA
jgi:glycosyltransferase involved in cell wall biosynthesis